VRIAAVTSRQNAASRCGRVAPGSRACLGRESAFHTRVDGGENSRERRGFYFLALRMGWRRNLPAPLVEAGKRVIDLSADFRFRDADLYKEFYGEEHGPVIFFRGSLWISGIAPGKIAAAAWSLRQVVIRRASAPVGALVEAGLLKASDDHCQQRERRERCGPEGETTLLYAECNESLRAYAFPNTGTFLKSNRS